MDINVGPRGRISASPEERKPSLKSSETRMHASVHHERSFELQLVITSRLRKKSYIVSSGRISEIEAHLVLQHLKRLHMPFLLPKRVPTLTSPAPSERRRSPPRLLPINHLSHSTAEQPQTHTRSRIRHRQRCICIPAAMASASAYHPSQLEQRHSAHDTTRAAKLLGQVDRLKDV
ncbi:hypothetical protein GALMADRAFT_232794 [Galerina marginata CBS 339.88]|uniref:Uncharacterized protein n=1 Tax=Galerina marginata (strain CBS 339.88) TaxID=685588 RepID=A0A067S7L6_GALM3|nr:hypothetical protein GALMADRAFT_232794 [Galerina marginata CBS 339.88]